MALVCWFLINGDGEGGEGVGMLHRVWLLVAFKIYMLGREVWWLWWWLLGLRYLWYLVGCWYYGSWWWYWWGNSWKIFQNDDNTCAVARIHFHLKLHLTSDQCHWHWRWKGQFHWYLPDSGRDRLWLDIQSRWSSSLAWLYRRNPLPPEEKVDQKKRRKMTDDFTAFS